MSRRFTAHDKRIVGARQHWRCAACELMLDETFHVDHIKPLHMGGEDDLASNAQALCVSCHAKKTTREEAARLQRIRTVVYSHTRPPVVCSACRAVISPFFASSHRCALAER